ncbi:MAG: quinolinate synthase NadA [Oscillospiraceae bacterium]|nr:quinolinate synthase NadA [Oscillospiraceae bacterium]
MPTISDIQKRIIELKKEKDVCILAHCYQTHDILEVADFTGDSFALARKAEKSPSKNVMMCGVRFMAETVKILSPEKRVYLPEPDAGCPMADKLDKGSLMRLKEQYPDHTVVCYINTTSDLKTICDVCVTSSSAVQILKKIDSDKILFIPDCNLGDYVSKQVPDKEFKFINGGCPVHRRLSKMDVTAAKLEHPDALLLVHPECSPEVVAMADYAGSTTGIMDYALASDRKEFIIGTENAIVSHLSIEHPEKRFYPLSKETICPNMKLTTLTSVLNCLEGTGGDEILLDEDTRLAAKKCIDRMLELG